jgi:hypothetical protein
MSAEHVFSDWMDKLFPGEKTFTMTNSSGKVAHWPSANLNWEAKVVCKTCNNGWMSRLESIHAQPVMTPLIQAKTSVLVNESASRSLAIFAFKTAVVIDATQRDKPPFFSRRIRYAFRESLAIPPAINMWMNYYSGPRGALLARASYHNGEIAPGYRLQLYVATCCIGRFVFQVVAHKQVGSRVFAPLPGSDGLEMWPPRPAVVWPGSLGLRDFKAFQAFADRWESIQSVD